MSRTMQVVGVAAMVLTVGCGDGGAAVLKRRSDLTELGRAYQSFHDEQQRGPANAIELIESMSQAAESDEKVASAIKSLEEGEIVMNWQGVLGDPAANSQYVLGFEARAPASGGYVVMADGKVRLMTGKDFSESAMVPSQVASP